LQTLQVRAEVQQDLHEISGFDKRRSIFSEECRSCHADPAAGKTGQALYESLCATCHGSLEVRDHVRSLNAAHVAEDEDLVDLRELIAAGNGRGMPGFSSAEGGPLSDAQIDSLVELFRKWQKSEKRKHGR
ncbi:MAG: cytochrome c, partial [Acidobacteria bacterium]|nr:cytochrome c [Acidobacteriota bacterium]